MASVMDDVYRKQTRSATHQSDEDEHRGFFKRRLPLFVLGTLGAIVLIVGIIQSSKVTCDEGHYLVRPSQILEPTPGTGGSKTQEKRQHSRPRVLCSILVNPKRETSIQKATIINNTWGSHCDILIFVASEPIPLNLTHTMLVKPVENETSLVIYPKVYEMWSNIYLQYVNQADWFIKADDDTFINLPKFRSYVSENFDRSDKSTPRFIGRRWKLGGNEQHTLNDGGAGYAVNQAALRTFGQLGVEDRKKILAQSAGAAGGAPTEASSAADAEELQKHAVCDPIPYPEDVRFADCLGSMDIIPEDTRDEFGKERFVHFNLNQQFSSRYHNDWDKIRYWYPKYSFNSKMYADGISKELISLHHCDDEALLQYYYIFYE